MESIDTELANKIRRDVFLGTYDDGMRLSEAQLCDTYGVSRTPVRLALRLLERERRAPGPLAGAAALHRLYQAVVS